MDVVVRGTTAEEADYSLGPAGGPSRTPRWQHQAGEPFRSAWRNNAWAAGWRGALVVGSCALAFALGTCYRPAGSRSSASVPSSALLAGELLAQVELKEDGKRYAYVMMAYDYNNSVGDTLWGALAMARALQRFHSKYPLVLLTNYTVLPDGHDMRQTFEKLNVQVLPVHTIKMPQEPGWTFDRWAVAFWKLQVWRLTQFDKLIWMDSDAIAYRDLDWIFDKPGMWAQRDDWFCEGKAQRICSGIMSLEPSMEIYDGLIRYAGQIVNTMHRGDQQLISQYFSEIVHKPIQLLDDADAAFGQCLGTAAGVGFEGVNPGSWWDTRAFVHKSGGWENTNDNAYNNVCFSHNMTRQRYVIGGKVINVCHLHPLGAYWRALFCEASSIVGAHLSEVMTFCSDSCYYTGLGLDGRACEDNQAWQLTTPLSATLQRYPPSLMFHLAPLGRPALVEAEDPFPSLAHKGYVTYQSLDMSAWSCRGACAGGGCCNQEDCEWQCLHNAQMKGGWCNEARFVSSSMRCQMFGTVKAVYSSRGGHSGVVFSESLAYPGAELPKAPFSIVARIRSTSKASCQDIIAWGDGQGSWKSVEFRLTSGNLLYGEAGDAGWNEVASHELKLADGAWHHVAVVRQANREVVLYVDGNKVAKGSVGEDLEDILPMARSARMSHTPGCIFDGDIGHLDIYDFEVQPTLLNKIIAAAE